MTSWTGRPGDLFLLGVNYWPRSRAMAMWKCFDRTEIRADLERIHALGLHAVRFFLTWEAFQPVPDRIDVGMLDKLAWFMEEIARVNLIAMPTLFSGHMSGVNWLPSWTLDRSVPAGRFRTMSDGREVPYGIADFYTGDLLEAQCYQAEIVGERLRAHPAVLAWDLGNEFSNMREPLTSADAADWSLRLSRTLHESSALPCTGGTHGEDITRDRNLRLSTLCAPWAFATMHGYSVYSDFARGRLDDQVVPFLSEIAASCASKPVLFSEFGNPTCVAGALALDHVAATGASAHGTGAQFACLTEEEMKAYARSILRSLHASGGLGAFWWCWADYAVELAQTPPFDGAPHELTFGIIRNDGSLKPIADVLTAFASQKSVILEPVRPLTSEDQYFAELPQVVKQEYDRYLAIPQVNGQGFAEQ